MINTGDFKATYTTVADQTTWYPVTFQYDSPNNTPELWVTIDGEGQTYGTDYIVGVGGVQLTYEPDAGLELIIRRNVPLTQEIDFQIGIIDPEQIEHGFDRSVMRDQEIADYAEYVDGNVQEIKDIIDSYGDIVTHNVSEFATASQGAKADTAVQPGDNVSVLANDANYVVASDLATVATTGSYNDLTDKPTIGNGTITITQGGVTKGSFSVNQAGATTIDVDSGGGGAVDSVNGKTGVVVLNASDVGALPSTTKYGASLSLSINSTTYVLTATLKDQNGNTLGSAQTIDLPLESVVVSGAYDSATKEVVLTLQGGSTIRFSVADLVSGLQTEITSLNMLDADLVDDSTSTNKFVTASEKTAISTAVQPGDLATVATSGDYGDLLNKPTIPDTTHMVTDNTAQNISAVKTFTAANPDATTSQTIVANYAVKFGTSGNNDLFSISANTNTSTLNIVGDNASNIIDIAASGAVLNHFQVTSSDVTFGGNSLINPGVMTGADGVNAGTSGLVPAPAATDDDKFLCGDGTWKAAGGGLPSQTGQDGKFLTTDGTDASWSDEPLLNDSTSSTGLAIGTTSDADFSVVIGESAFSVPFSSDVVAIGYSAAAMGSSVAIGKAAQSSVGSIAIGSAVTSGDGGIIIGGYGVSTTGTDHAFDIVLNHYDPILGINRHEKYTICDIDGHFPTDRLTKVNTTATLAVADWSSNTQTVTVSGVKADSVVFVSPAPASASDYASAGILCTAQAVNSLTFTCTTTPTNAITVNVVCM